MSAGGWGPPAIRKLRLAREVPEDLILEPRGY